MFEYLEVEYLEVLVEEYSAEEALQNLLPKILPSHVVFEIHSFQGKADLLKKLPERLKGYKAWLPPAWRILVLCDRDNDDCQDLKRKLEDSAIHSGFTTKTNPASDRFIVLNRMAIEELEAWFLGDVKALTEAYPRIPPTFADRKRYRNPDEISGGTWEALEALLQLYGYHLGGLNKVEAARDISKYMTPDNNRSTSFQCFYTGLKAWFDRA